MKKMMMNRENQYAHERIQLDALRASLTKDGQLLYAGRLLERAAKHAPDRVALIYDNKKITFGQLFSRVCAFAQVLREHNVQPEDRVLICFENSPEFYIAYYAIWQVGAIVAPLNTFLKEHEIKHIVSDANPALIVTEVDRVSLFKDTGIELPEILTQEDMPEDSIINEKSCIAQTIDLPRDQMCALLYTSGTTGLPKGVMLSSENILSNLLSGAARLPTRDEDRIFGVLPLFHVFAQFICVWGSIFLYATVIIVKKIDRRLIVENLKYKPTIFIGVPALYGLLCLLRTASIDGVDYFISGGDALPDKIRMAFELLYRRKIISGYGLTETSPLISADLFDEMTLTNVVGRPILDVAVSIRDNDGKQLPDEHIGEIWISGNNVMLGYYNEPEQTKKVMEGEWFKTGDLGYLDHQGRLVITGRLKDLIIHKGFNIYPQEIENVITSHPNVLRAGVIGVDRNGDEVPVAFVQLRKQQDNIEEKLKKLCQDHLAAYKIPRIFYCTTRDLPATATGKVDKKVLRAQGEDAIKKN